MTEKMMSGAASARALSGRHAVVTGGSRGIGLCIAQTLADMGARVTLMGRDEQALQDAASTLSGARLADAQLHAQSSYPAQQVTTADAPYSAGVAWATCDVASPEDVQRAFAAARRVNGPIDILVNNAGQAVSQRFDRLDEDGWTRMLSVNLSGTFHCMQAALPDMKESGWGRIVNVASTAGLKGYAYVSAYCAAKHGVVGLTRAVALEVAGQGITVNAVCPGYTETDIVREAVANIRRKTGGSEQQALGQLTARNPQGRLVQPEQVAAAVAWLCQPMSAAVNGQSIAIDGGELAG